MICKLGKQWIRESPQNVSVYCVFSNSTLWWLLPLHFYCISINYVGNNWRTGGDRRELGNSGHRARLLLAAKLITGVYGENKHHDMVENLVGDETVWVGQVTSPRTGVVLQQAASAWEQQFRHHCGPLHPGRMSDTTFSSLSSHLNKSHCLPFYIMLLTRTDD